MVDGSEQTVPLLANSRHRSRAQFGRKLIGYNVARAVVAPNLIK